MITSGFVCGGFRPWPGSAVLRSVFSAGLFAAGLAGCGDRGAPADAASDAADVLADGTSPGGDGSSTSGDTTVETSPSPPTGPTDCVIGSLACSCGESGGCALDPDGEPLTCVAGVCLRPTCPSGNLGCACKNGACNDGTCQAGTCVRAGCALGSQNCACAQGSCDVGLFCKDGAVCVDSAGYEGGKCLANGACREGNRCDPVQGLCVYCDRGTQGCACSAAGTCASGLTCAAGICASAADLPPDEPACYTPCRRDLNALGDSRPCSADGLIAGCIDGQACVDGSCLLPGEDKPSCSSDVECPFFQACLGGGCYSNCESSLDCPSGRGCHQKVCRVPCLLATGTSACPDGMTCDSSDGETGFCVPIVAPSETPLTLPTGTTFTIESEGLESLTNLHTDGVLRLVPSGPGLQRMTIRKVAHDLYDARGGREAIEAPVDPDTGELLPCQGAATDCPLWWLELSSGATTTRGETLEVTCDGTCPAVTIRNAGGAPGVRYSGRLVVSGPGGTQPVALDYVEEVSGRWEGQVHYFTVFEDDGVDAWKDRDDKSDVTDVKNALIQRWGAFRRGNLEGWEELEAVLTSTRTGSWNQPRTRELCDQVTDGSPNAVCYPFKNTAGVRVYVQDEEAAPVPSATTELPIAIQVRARLDDPKVYSGRIDSQAALHYPGNPAVSLELSADPARPGACDPRIPSACVVYVDALSAEVTLGARYQTKGTCISGFEARAVPWLVPGFDDDTAVDPALGRVRTECRDAQLPFAPVDEQQKLLDIDLAGANPSPDGRVRNRRLELLDGALIDQTTLFLLVRESFEGFIPGQPTVPAYAFITLKRTPVDLADEDFVGTPAATTTRPTPFPGVTCSASLLDSLPTEVTDDRNRLVRVLIDGSAGDTSAFALDPVADPQNQIHYLCDGRFDGGGATAIIEVDALSDAPPDSGGYQEPLTDGTVLVQLPEPCLPGSEVTFFDTGSNFTARSVIEEACQEAGTCRETFDQWKASGFIQEVDPTWRCIDPTQALCNVNVKDLRDGKTFYRKRATAPSFSLQRLAAAIDDAFRYKTRFQSDLDQDAEVGFTPAECVPGSDAVPYCYDAQAIEQVRARIDCLVEIYSLAIDGLGAEERRALEAFLRGNFSSLQGHDGFERLYAELLVMLGDEELTGAFASRFDLAGVATRNFDGTAFELRGINLSGVAGAEMQRLYAATQYYEMALDRLYRLGPNLAVALLRGDTSSPANMVSPQTVTLYLGRLVRASSQMASAWSEIAKRYRDFNRADIARHVLERAYARTYMESVMLARLTLDIAEQSGLSFKDQIIAELETAQRTFRVAMLDMRDVFDTIVRGATFFGFPPEYIPFPAIDTGAASAGNNGFEVLLATARNRLAIAKEREQVAFDSLISGRVDRAQFQSQLTDVRNNYEDQLATLCGTFVGDDGVTYPAIKRYADRSQVALVTGDPCGLYPVGTIYEGMLEVDAATAALDGVLTRYRNVRGEIETEQTRVAAQCNLIRSIATFEYEKGLEVRDSRRDQAITSAAINGGVRLLTAAKEALDAFQNCLTAFDPPSKMVCGGLAGVSGGLGVAAAIAEGVAAGVAAKFEFDIEGKRLSTGRWLTETQCDAQLIDSAARMQTLIRSLDEVTLEALRAQIELELQVSQVARSFNEAQRLQERQDEAQQLLINVEAARNDPNVRIFRNDAIINADFAFEDAMRAAYRATRMYEYYTSTSYPRLDELFLVRLASRGLPNLENYLTELENAFQEFEDELGLPDARVAILSLRDDILKIPYLGDDGKALSDAARSQRMTAVLEDPARLDKNGYIVLPFGTSVDELSPLTRNHKIRFIEANIIGSEIGDRLGRLYLRQRGTSIIRTVDDRTDYYVFPERTAVIDTFFNGNRIFAADVYENLRLRDRPYAHTMWELIINRRDEAVNRDIELSSLSDIQIFVHYTDFTVF